ncbi:purine-cytosine permease family protein [Modicisalibacter xianhensis]|uniref:Putative hydroxymethylpyrimidine transporter CytX n=1 Tax=Modicisalibacter xianhensis TaxID=442341 RepID=A0A1I2YY02_9GAMM|nr:cytosine permease [Halomonas xianhensis]SFH29551.1 putative hydroxymethylpyrimidine transporter CytX [Halomonas xianhensis]
MNTAKTSSAFGQDTLDAVSHERSLGLPGTFALWLGANVVVTTILTGMFLSPDLAFLHAMTLVFLGSAIGIVPLVLIGVMGQQTGMTTMVLARGTFGRMGAVFPAWVNLLALVAWSWIQALLAGMSLDYAVQSLTGYSNVALFTVICEGLVVLITLRGHLGIETAEKIAAVLMLLLAGVVVYALATNYDLPSIVEMQARGGLGAGVAFDIVIATAFSWIPLAADYNRHCKSLRAAVAGTWGGYVTATLVAMGLGASVSALSVAIGFPQTYDPTQLLSGFGFGLPAALVIFFSVLTTNVMCVYSATLSYMSTAPRTPFWKPALVIGVISVVGSLIPGILDQFQTFLLIIGSVFIPAFALMIVDYFLLGRERYSADQLLGHTGTLPAINPVAFVSYGVGAALAYYWNWVAPLDFGASLPVFVITGALYFVASRLTRRSGRAVA